MLVSLKGGGSSALKTTWLVEADLDETDMTDKMIAERASIRVKGASFFMRYLTSAEVVTVGRQQTSAAQSNPVQLKWL